MPNKISPRGFVPSRYASGATWNGATNVYFIPSTDASMFSVGDAVKAAAGGDAMGVPAVAKALGTDTVRGVIVGVLPVAPNEPSLQATVLDLTNTNIPAVKLKGYYVMVCDDPDVLFEIEDDGLAALTATACNKNASFTVANPVAPSMVSQSVLATGTIGTVATLNLRLFGLVQRPDNLYGVNANWLVKFNLHELNGATVGV